MDPASDRSYHTGAPAPLRRGSGSRRGFSEVKSPSLASNYDNRSRHSDERDHRSQHGDRRGSGSNPSQHRGSPSGGPPDGGGKKSLDRHLHARNAKGRARQPLELDLESADKGQAATWASRDWCAEARKSRMILREREKGTMGSVREDGGRLFNEGGNYGEGNYGEGNYDGMNEGGRIPRRGSGNSLGEGADVRSHMPEGSRDRGRVDNCREEGDAKSHIPEPNRRRQIQEIAHSQKPSADDFSCLWNAAAADAHPLNGGGSPDNSSRYGDVDNRSGHGRGRPAPPPAHRRQGSGRSTGGSQARQGGGRSMGGREEEHCRGDSHGSEYYERMRRMEERERAQNAHSPHASPGGPGGKMPSRHSLNQGRPREQRPLANSISNGSQRGDDDRSRARSADGPNANEGARSKGRGAERQGQPRSQPRSRSRGPNERGRPSGPPVGSAKSVRSSTPGTKHRSRSKSLRRPTKKLGCMGSSTDMTRRSRSRSRGPAGQRERSRSGDMQAGMESFEKEMKGKRRQSQTDRMNKGLRGSHTSGDKSLSRGRSGSGRSQSRGPQGRSQSGRSRSRGPAAGRPGGARSKSRTRGKSEDKTLTRGKGGGRAAPDDLSTKLRKSRSFHDGGRDAATCDTRTTRSSKHSRSRGVQKKKKGKKKGSNKTVASSAHSSSSSSTPETGPLSSYSGKSSKGSLLKAGSGRHRLGPSVPPSTPPRLDDDRSRPATPNRGACDDSTVGTGRSGRSSGGRGGEEIATCLFDRRGYCVRHPHVRLRKKKMLGGWQVLIANCPDCCVEEMGRLKKVRKQLKKRKEKAAGEKAKAVDEGRGRSRETDAARAGGARSKSRGGARGKSQSRTSGSSRGGMDSSHRSSKGTEDAGPVFEFDIPIGDSISGRMSAGRSVKSKKSHRSSASRRSSKSNRSTKSGGSARTSRSRTSKGGNDKSVTRGARPGSSQRFIRQGCNLRVAKMPFTDKYKREGKYTGEINEHGQPHGRGTLRYNNGLVYEGLWTEGHSPEMDANMGRAKNSGFGNWKDGTHRSKKERERRKNEDMEDLRSFISQSVRSGATNADGSQLGSQCGSAVVGNHRRPSSSRSPAHNGRGSHGGPAKETVESMPWSDVNGFSGQYTGEVNQDQIPDGRGYMQYSNGVVEEGMFRNGVFQPPTSAPPPSFRNNDGLGGGGGGGGVPSSSMSVWSLKSSPTMAFQNGGHDVLTGRHPGGAGAGGGVMGAPTSVHLGGPGGMYSNVDRSF